MNMLYHIGSYAPCPGMGNGGFIVKLWPAWRDAVAASGLKQENVNRAIVTMGRAWLDGHGYDRIFDPDNCGFNADRGQE